MAGGETIEEFREHCRIAFAKLEEKRKNRGTVVYQWSGMWADWCKVGHELDCTAVEVWTTGSEIDEITDRDEVESILRERWPKVIHWHLLTQRFLGGCGTEFHFD